MTLQKIIRFGHDTCLDADARFTSQFYVMCSGVVDGLTDSNTTAWYFFL